MTVRFAQWTIDALDVELMASFWSAALGYRVEREPDGSAHLRSPVDGEPSVWLQAGGAVKRDKNRNHPDLRPATGSTVDQEVERLIALGATRADVGQKGDEPFEVLADPEGNEFCVLHP
ncbi:MULTISPECIES: VOC family protein [Catenuloplanes]|uniref:Glyoxalase-like domain-containing protein n=1 Tax=Catenuloplanes niger TaxID=587534 RepID=A0AAE3ZTK3_9ACTN|nr:VOC family protein [Catenuloplanes niger]MDR7325456.1 hypothetical protein [Catenuloplanes niger]